MKNSKLVLPEQFVELSEKEMEQVEGGNKDLLDHIADFWASILKRDKK